MNLIKPTVTRLYQEPGIQGAYKAVQIAAFVCYQTEKTKYNPKEFIEKVLLPNAHMRPLEFGRVCLIVPDTMENIMIIAKYRNNKFSKVINVDNDPNVYITTNLRVIMQGSSITDKGAFEKGYSLNWLDDITRFWSEPTQYHDSCAWFTMNASRGVTDDFRTHIGLSSICESTRWCKYNGKKFDNKLNIIKPYTVENEGDYNKEYTLEEVLKMTNKEQSMMASLRIMEQLYMHQMSLDKVEAQEGKRLVPLDIKAQLMLRGFSEAWDNFLWRRCDKHADPECQLIANEIKTSIHP